MVNEGIVLGHKVSKRGIEVDKAKVDAIEKMPCPKDIKGIRSFLGHAGFYRRFIKDFSKISRPLTYLLQKDIPFVFDDDCIEAFEILKKALISAPIVQPPDWNLPFEIMCDASDYAVGVVLGQIVDKKLNVIQYVSKKIISKLSGRDSAATRRNLGETNLGLRQSCSAGDTSLREGEIIAIVITNAPLIERGQSPSTSSPAPSPLKP